MLLLVLLAALACKYGAKEAAGSGLPEFKYLLASEMQAKEYEHLVSKRIFFFKVVGLIFSVGGGLSVGSEGPLVHTAACIAFLLMKYIPDFDEILQSPSLTKQIFAASAAVGVSSAFNAPVGGLLFSVEVTSTFYLVSNYWKVSSISNYLDMT
jgi:H+/Cl- antiporter ClcA